MTNVLYFEGAGMDFYEEAIEKSDVGNFRIRTAFKNLEGKEFFISLGRSSRYSNIGKNGRELKKSIVVSDWALHIDSLFEIKYSGDDENNHRIKTNHLEINKLDYSKHDITKWINENLNCNFDTIEVLDSFYGYHVHSGYVEGNSSYNFMENIELIPERAIARKEAYEKVDQEYRTLLNEKYSIIGLLEMDAESITIRCHASDQALGDIERIKKIAIKY